MIGFYCPPPLGPLGGAPGPFPQVVPAAQVDFTIRPLMDGNEERVYALTAGAVLMARLFSTHTQN